MAVFKRTKKGRKKTATYHYYQFDYKGRRYQGSAPTRREAELAEARRRLEVERGVQQRSAIKVEAFFEMNYKPYSKDYKTAWKRDLEIAAPFVEHFRGQRLAEVGAQAIREYLSLRAKVPTQHGTTRSNATLNRERSVISSFFSLAVEEDFIEENPVERVKTRKAAPPRLLYWTEDEQARVMPYFSGEREHLRVMVELALLTGLRRAELFSAKVGQVDLVNKVLAVYAPKTKSWRFVALEPRAIELLRPLTENRSPKAVLFVSDRTNDAYRDPKKGIRKACELAGVRFIGWHGLRHTRGTRLALRGMNAFQIAQELGHADIRTSQQYIHLAEAAQRATEAGQLFEAPEAQETRVSAGKSPEKVSKAS